MRRYFFNVHDARCEPDADGVELPSLESALTAANKLVADLLHASNVIEHPIRHLTVDVTDSSGAVVATLTFTVSTADQIPSPIAVNPRGGPRSERSR